MNIYIHADNLFYCIYIKSFENSLLAYHSYSALEG